MNDQPATAIITPRHYQVICGLSLGGIIMVQTQMLNIDAALLLALHAVLVAAAALALLNQARISPALLLIIMAIPYLVEQWQANAPGAGFADRRFFNLADVVVCIAALTYVIGHYRLLGLQGGVLPADRRLQADATSRKMPSHVRSEQSLRSSELAALIFTAPSFAVLAQFACRTLKQPRFLDINPRINEFLLFLWILLAGMFVCAEMFRYWRRRQMDRASALLMLQDMLWHETRGEQRRIQRWLAWRKLRG
jgi:hypothetical protein